MYVQAPASQLADFFACENSTGDDDPTRHGLSSFRSHHKLPPAIAIASKLQSNSLYPTMTGRTAGKYNIECDT